jgi:hypothetical protein
MPWDPSCACCGTAGDNKSDNRGSLAEDAEWKRFVKHLVQAKRELASAWQILDGTDGADPASEEAITAATDAIDAIYRVESQHAFNMDVASPQDVQEFWERHSQLPGFALGT